MELALALLGLTVDPQRKPKLHLPVCKNAQVGKEEKQEPENEDPPPLWYGFCPVSDHERYRVVLVGEDLDS
jgi:hypothetical protein